MQRTTLSMALMIVSVGTVFTAVGQSQVATRPRNAYKIEEKRLGPLMRRSLPPVVSKDGCHMAYAVFSSGEFLVVLDGPDCRPIPRFQLDSSVLSNYQNPNPFLKYVYL